MNDAVNHPDHYTQGGVECIEAIEAALTPDEYLGYLRGQVFKYMWRFKQKPTLGDEQDDSQDLKKALWYLNRMIDGLDAEYKKQLELFENLNKQ